jgi:GxxExxY protein
VRSDIITTRDNDLLTEEVIGFAIEVHRALGSGLLESAHEECLCLELKHGGLSFRRQAALPIFYKFVRLDCRYRLDIVIEDRVILELKTVERLMPLHEAQMLTYLELSGIRSGFLLNFNSAVLKDGMRRLML